MDRDESIIQISGQLEGAWPRPCCSLNSNLSAPLIHKLTLIETTSIQRCTAHFEK